MSEDPKKTIKRSERVVKMFNQMAGVSFKDIPIDFIPALTKWLNGKLISAKRGEIEVEFETRAEMANPTGLLHGGMQSAIMDDSIGITTATLGHKGFLISIDMHINYLGKVKIGEKIRCKTKVLREGKKITNIRAEIYDSGNNMVATANSNLIKTDFTPEWVKQTDKM